MKTFGQRLGAHLAAMRVSQAELAAELERRGVRSTRAAVNYWVNDRARPEPWKWSTLLDVLGVPFTDRREWEALMAERTPAAARQRRDPRASVA